MTDDAIGFPEAPSATLRDVERANRKLAGCLAQESGQEACSAGSFNAPAAGQERSVHVRWPAATPSMRRHRLRPSRCERRMKD